MNNYQISTLVLLSIILLLCIFLTLGGLYAYKWYMYYLNNWDQYVDDFNEMKSQIDEISKIKHLL